MFEPRLGVNIDHVATLRQLRGTPYPNLIQMAQRVVEAGANQITVHLREDRRHIQDQDVRDLKKTLKVPLNLELALNEPILKFAEKLKPDWACIVPEKRQELTTEGGLDVEKKRNTLKKAIQRLKKKGIKVSLFIEPSQRAVKLSAELGADAVEFHTGRYALLTQKTKQTTTAQKKKIESELQRLRKAAILARKLGVAPHAGHGLDYENIRDVVFMTDDEGLPLIEEYNVGHSIVCRSSEVGMGRAVREMVSAVKAP